MADKSRYKKLQDTLNELQCPVCAGGGKLDDAGIGDIFYNEWPCPKCEGSGVKDNAIVMMTISGEKGEKVA